MKFQEAWTYLSKIYPTSWKGTWLEDFAQLAPLKEGSLDKKLTFQKGLELYISQRCHHWHFIADKTRCISSIVVCWNSLSRIVQVKMKWRWMIFSTIRLTAWSVHVCTLLKHIGKISFQRPSVWAPIRGLAWMLIENKVPSHDCVFLLKVKIACTAVELVAFQIIWLQCIYKYAWNLHHFSNHISPL